LEKYPLRQLAGGLSYVTSGSERGRWKSTQMGNSLASYSTVCCVRRGEHVPAHEVGRFLPYRRTAHSVRFFGLS
jgi:hypothetical protein